MPGQLSGVCGHKLFLPALTGKCVENAFNFDFLVGIPQFHIGNSNVNNADILLFAFEWRVRILQRRCRCVNFRQTRSLSAPLHVVRQVVSIAISLVLAAAIFPWARFHKAVKLDFLIVRYPNYT